MNGSPHLCMFAKRCIKEGEELTYSYNADNLPWRQVSFAVVFSFSVLYLGMLKYFFFTYKGNKDDSKDRSSQIYLIQLRYLAYLS